MTPVRKILAQLTKHGKRKIAAVILAFGLVAGFAAPASAGGVTIAHDGYMVAFNDYAYHIANSDSASYVDVYNGNGNYIGELYGVGDTCYYSGYSNGYWQRRSIYTGILISSYYFTTRSGQFYRCQDV